MMGDEQGTVGNLIHQIGSHYWPNILSEVLNPLALYV